MLWSLIKIVIFVALVTAMSLGAGYLMESQGGVRVAVGSWEVNLGPLQSVIAALVLVLAVWLFFKLFGLLIAVLKFINGDETALSRYFDRNRERKGYQALSEGLMALASGEGRLAIAKAEKAQKYLRKPELTDLVVAQAAELSGDREKAQKVYKRLLQNENTRFVGVRGLMRQKLAEGDTETALKLAEKAFSLKPKHPEVQDTLLQLQASNADWSGARKTLDAKLRSGTLPRDVHKRRDAVLALSEARDVVDESKSVQAREAAIEAARKSPDLVPAVVMAARGYIAQGQPRYATRMIKKAWQINPHPDLAAVFAEIAPDETPAQRIKRFESLLKLAPDHPESRMVSAELYLAAEDFPAARRAIAPLVETHPDARVLTIMAAIEKGEGSPDHVVNGWLTKALTAPRGPQWVCDKCNNIHADWVPVCRNCGAFDTLSWKSPPQAELTLPGGAEMLPLLVGPSQPAKTALPDAEAPTSDGDAREDTSEDDPIEDAEVISESSTKKADA